MAEWQWDPRSARYRNLDTGRFVSQKQVAEWAALSIEASPVIRWADQLASERLSVGAWQAQMRAEIKAEYIRQYLAGRGGLEQMTPRDWGSIGGMLAEQYKYLDGFAAEIASGNLSAGQVAQRSTMYVNSGREAFERARERSAADAGMGRVRWSLNNAEHCEDCVALSQMGWQRVEPWPFAVGGEQARPGSGATRCKTNCRCNLEWKK